MSAPKTRSIPGVLTLVLTVALAACGDSGTSGDGTRGEPSNPAPGPEDPPAEECATGESYDSTYDAIQQIVFERQGCTQDACHGSAKSGGLELTAGQSWANIYSVRAQGSSLALIEPGDEDRSYLWLKLAAATRPGQYQIAGSPMPSGLAAISENDLELLRTWIYAGAPETGNVLGTESFLEGCLPPAAPIEIEPLEPPAAGTGIQIKMPEWTLRGGEEFEGCFASVYDVTDQVPERFRSGNTFLWNKSEVRQDPQSHHLFLYMPLNNFAGGVDIYDPAFGEWTCAGGPMVGQPCDQGDLASCGDEGICTSEIVESFGCTGYGPSNVGFNTLIGGAGQPVFRTIFADGVFAPLPLKGVIYWNSHAFNLTSTEGTMHAAINYEFAKDTRFPISSIANFSAIFRPNALPYTRETYCNEHVLPQGMRLFEIYTHTHKRGERTWITLPDGTMIYENFSFSDPLQARFDPPLEFDSPNAEDRTLTYCGTYNNGVAPDGSPDPKTVSRLSLVRKAAGDQFGGNCEPLACAAGRVGEPCDGEGDDAACDSSPGSGDGWCDACRITGGESTENEMFNLFGFGYVDPVGAGAAE